MCTWFYAEKSVLSPIITKAQQLPLADTIRNTMSRSAEMSGNIRPTDMAAVFAPNKQGNMAVFPMIWGFTVKQSSKPLINCRIETADQKPVWKDSWFRRRCVIPASWYYEWGIPPSEVGYRNANEQRNIKKEKYAIQPEGAEITYIAGLYRFEEHRGIQIPMFAVITRKSVEPVSSIHDRMPLILGKDSLRDWVRPDGDPGRIAYSGEEALEMVKLRHARRQPYNLILVDLKMPGMDGIETTREIRRIVGHESAIIIITAYKWDDVLEEAVSAGADSFIAKPLFANNVIEEFRNALKKKRSAKKAAAKAELKGRRILLAEDVEINADIMTMVLAMREIEVDLAENGKIAVDKFIASETWYYDAILMDIRMPEMDGLEAASLIRDLDRPDAKTIPIIALTANAFDEDVQRSMQAGMNAHLSKPIDNDTLFSTLENLIHDQ